MLRESFIEAAFNQSTYAINITDLQGKLITVNNAYLELYGFINEAEVIGQNQTLIRSDKNSRSVYKDMWTCITHNKVWNGEIINRHRNGDDIYVHLTIIPIFENGIKVGYMGFTMDRNQQVHLEKQLLHANKLVVIGTIGAGIAHELNNPLTSISLEAEWLEEQMQQGHICKDLEQSMASIRSINQALERMKRVVNHMLIYSRQDSAKNWELFSVKQLINDALLFMDRQFKNRNIQLEVKVTEDLVIYGHKTNLESVLHNLLTNSRDAFEKSNSAHKTIVLEAFKQDATVCLNYCDNAGGIPKDHQEKIFDPFFTTKEEGKGTGLGLSITQKIVAEHYGKIMCESDAEVTFFRIQLPQLWTKSEEV
jgi:PAS domain S-box-containing protein